MNKQAIQFQKNLKRADHLNTRLVTPENLWQHLQNIAPQKEKHDETTTKSIASVIFIEAHVSMMTM